MLASLIAVLALAHSALAGVYITNPTASSSGTGGQVLRVTWADDGNSPNVTAIGPASVDIYTGSKTTQFRLQNLAASVDVSKASAINATVDPSIGPSGAYYFIRFTSLALKDATMPQYNYQAYSARFTLNNMSGTFNSTVQAALADINGTSITTATTAAKTSTTASATSTRTNGTASASVNTSGAHASIAIAGPGVMAAALVVAAFMAL